MSRKKHFQKSQTAPAKAPPPTETAAAASPYLPNAHPPIKHPTLLAVSAILFVVWFLFLLMAALSR